MKIFVDTNILLDLLLDRENSEQASVVLNSIDIGLFRGVVSDITMVNIFYIAKKQRKIEEIRQFLSLLIDIFEICTPDEKIFKEALNLQNSDFEDNIQYLLAKKNDCDCIITNDKKFRFKDIEILSSEEFINKFLLG